MTVAVYLGLFLSWLWCETLVFIFANSYGFALRTWNGNWIKFLFQPIISNNSLVLQRRTCNSVITSAINAISWDWFTWRYRVVNGIYLLVTFDESNYIYTSFTFLVPLLESIKSPSKYRFIYKAEMISFICGIWYPLCGRCIENIVKSDVISISNRLFSKWNCFERRISNNNGNIVGDSTKIIKIMQRGYVLKKTAMCIASCYRLKIAATTHILIFNHSA